MKLFLLLLAFAAASCAAENPKQSPAKGPYNPEEMIFIYTRCMEDSLTNLTGTDRNDTLARLSQWTGEQLDDPATQCFFKCVLEKTGLYDSATEKFDHRVIRKQQKAYPSFVKEKAKVDAYVKAIKKLRPAKNECKAVFKAYLVVHKDHLEASKNLLHGNSELSKEIYEKLGKKIRQRKQSYFEFCENKFYPAESKKYKNLCKIRQYDVPAHSPTFNKHIKCIFKGLRYITKDNKLDREEILRDFKQVNKDTQEVEKILSDCASKEPEDVGLQAYHYYRCLLESSAKEDFKEAFDYREVRSQNYGSGLAKKLEYKRSEVEAKLKEKDGKPCE